MNTRALLIFIVFLAVSGTASWMTFQYDIPVRQAVVKAQGDDWKKSDARQFHGAVRKYGDWPWLMLAGGVAFGIARLTRRKEWQRIIIAAMLASTASGILANASRLTTGRARPRESPRIAHGFYGPWNEGRLTIGDQAYNSFPSGHTATAFGAAGVILWARPWLGIGALMLATLVGWSSIMMGTHHLSDVVVSIFLSMAVSWFVWRWVRDHGEEAWSRIMQKWRRPRK